MMKQILAARAHWSDRPPAVRIVKPGPGQESVWDYPRPPRVEALDARVTVALGGATIADTRDAVRVLETAGAPVPYVPAGDIVEGELRRTREWGLCEWKGVYFYCDLVLAGRLLRRVGWTFPDPLDDLGCGYDVLRDRFAFYPALLECAIDGERVLPQPGRFYGGWVTSNITGPMKGEPGSEGW
jgi:uncharacterized protein (DUF427 family)